MLSLTILDQKINVVDDLYSLNDLHKSSGGANKHKPSYFMSNQETKDFIQELDSQNINAYHIKQGTKGGTYVCRELVYRYAMWISPKFSLMVIRAFDALNTGAIPCLERHTISAQQQAQIQQAIKTKCQHNKVHYQTLYHALYQTFGIPRYSELLACDFERALAFIWGFEFTPSLNTAFIANILADNAHQIKQAQDEFWGVMGDFRNILEHLDKLQRRLEKSERCIQALQKQF
ncbi:KilA-N domain-containing protein [Moraxella bovis]|uniref:KilA-N domain n=1 Tax=Moraxella bovis TaxID=476 RepID=A0A378PXQ8_MORBO|nr:KilA-N domain-containing protein [Moraxella bovis]STY93393.1 KilA-N domain [Moraxella bovis]